MKLKWTAERHGHDCSWRAVSDESGAEFTVERQGRAAVLFEDTRYIGTYRNITAAKAAAFQRDYVLGDA